MSDENDDDPDFPCGCHSVFEHHEFAYWIMCPTHEAAEKMLETLKWVYAQQLDFIECAHGEEILRRCKEAIDKATTKDQHE